MQVEVLSGASKSSISHIAADSKSSPHTIEAALALGDEELDELHYPEKKLRFSNNKHPLPDLN